MRLVWLSGANKLVVDGRLPLVGGFCGVVVEERRNRWRGLVCGNGLQIARMLLSVVGKATTIFR